MRAIDLADLAATEAWAARIAAVARPGDVILLSGPLGAGKTALARALLRSLIGDPRLEVPSPTFTLVQSYATPRMAAHHVDLWRLPAWSATAPDPLAELGWYDWQDDLVLVEWPERLGGRAPPDALHLTLAPGPSEDARVAHVRGWEDRL